MVKLKWAMALAMLGSLGTTLPASAQTADRSTQPVGSLTELAAFTGPGPSGIAVTPQGRVFVGFPRHAINHPGMTLGEWVDGKLVPYPDAATSLPSDRPDADKLVSVHGMTIDSRGRLWVIDDGKRAGQDGITAGAAKVVGIDPATNRIFASVVLSGALRQDSHMNDLRIDLTHGRDGTALVADSSFGTDPALVVVDIASGRQRRVLAQDASIKAQPDFVTQLDGVPLRYNGKQSTFPVGGVDSVALSDDSSRLFYSPLTGRHLWSLPTAALADFSKNDAALAKLVRDEGEKVMTDGIAMDNQDRLYLTDAEHHQILRRWPDGHLDVVLRDPRLVWPDGIYVNGHDLYVTLGQWDRLSKHSDTREPPYLLIKASVDATPVADAGAK